MHKSNAFGICGVTRSLNSQTLTKDSTQNFNSTLSLKLTDSNKGFNPEAMVVLSKEEERRGKNTAKKKSYFHFEDAM